MLATPKGMTRPSLPNLSVLKVCLYKWQASDVLHEGDKYLAFSIGSQVVYFNTTTQQINITQLVKAFGCNRQTLYHLIRQCKITESTILNSSRKMQGTHTSIQDGLTLCQSLELDRHKQMIGSTLLEIAVTSTPPPEEAQPSRVSLPAEEGSSFPASFAQQLLQKMMRSEVNLTPDPTIAAAQDNSEQREIDFDLLLNNITS